MTAEDLAQFRALLRTQSIPAPRVGLAGRLRGMVGGRGDGSGTLHLAAFEMLEADAGGPRIAPLAAADSRMFGRREPEPPTLPAAVHEGPPPSGPLLLTRLSAPAETALGEFPPIGRVSLRLTAVATAQTPYLPEDLCDDRLATAHPVSPGPSPGAIAGWSSEAPPSARSRLLTRIAAVCEAERRGLEARILSLAPA